MMTSPKKVTENNDEKDDWEPEAWVYFIWLVFGNRLYCKIGYSIDPISRYHQLIAGMPEQPFRIHLLSCLSVKQAKVFESMLHDHLHFCRTRGEWFLHANAKQFHKILKSKLDEIATLFYTFGYEPEFERIELDGDRPVLYQNGYISHVINGNDVDDD